MVLKALTERTDEANRFFVTGIESSYVGRKVAGTHGLIDQGNATSYGIYAEMNRQESDEKVRMVCHGIDAAPYECTVTHPENPGEYCFPPLASLITGAARLMLALLESSVTELGGTYAMEDTDSMAIVARVLTGSESGPQSGRCHGNRLIR